jgi:hypothetical protein
MDPAADPTDPDGPTERPPRAVFVVAAATAFVVPWVTQLGGPAWWGTAVPPLGVWLVTGASGVALVMTGGRARRLGTALVAGDVLGAVLFFVSFFVTLWLGLGGDSGG